MLTEQPKMQKTCADRQEATSQYPSGGLALRAVQSKLSCTYFLTIAVVMLVLSLPTSLLARQSSKSADPYPPAGWNLGLDDPLTVNNGNWQVNAACQFIQGVYQISAGVTQGTRCFNNAVSFSDFVFEAQVQGGSDLEEALRFRFSNSDNTGYSFYIGKKGEYTFYIRNKDSDRAEILAGGTSEAIHTGPDQSNLMAVVARGNTFDLYVNRQFIRTVIDEKNTFDHGTIGFGVRTPKNKPGEASFSNVKVWTPSASTPATTPTAQYVSGSR
jgi:hypothetical protein